MNIIGFFVSTVAGKSTDSEASKTKSLAQGQEFRSDIWGPNTLSTELGSLEYPNYGRDLHLILIQFFVNPLPDSEQAITEVERFRPKEKAIGLSIVVNEENFFSRSHDSRMAFLCEMINERLGTLCSVLKRRKLDTDTERLSCDVAKILDEWRKKPA